MTNQIANDEPEDERKRKRREAQSMKRKLITMLALAAVGSTCWLGGCGQFISKEEAERGAMCRVAEYSYVCAKAGIPLATVTNNVMICYPWRQR